MMEDRTQIRNLSDAMNSDDCVHSWHNHDVAGDETERRYVITDSVFDRGLESNVQDATVRHERSHEEHDKEEMDTRCNSVASWSANINIH